MKKIFGILLVVALLLSLVSCGNMDMSGMGTFTFRHVHISTHQQAICYTVTKWVDGSTGIEVNTEEAGPIFLSEGTYILFRNGKDCPFCNEKE